MSFIYIFKTHERSRRAVSVCHLGLSVSPAVQPPLSRLCTLVSGRDSVSRLTSGLPRRAEHIILLCEGSEWEWMGHAELFLRYSFMRVVWALQRLLAGVKSAANSYAVTLAERDTGNDSRVLTLII